MSDGPRLDPDCARMLAEQQAAGDPLLQTLGVGAARVTATRLAVESRSRDSAGWADVTAMTVDGAAGPLAARWYLPRETEHSGAMLLYFHGGGFALGDLDTHEDLCRRLAHHSGAGVLSVDYRLAPEDPFPAQNGDALAAWACARRLAGSLGCDLERIGVAGDSAGGNLAAVVGLRRGSEPVPACQLLIYPWLDMTMSAPSVERFATGFGLSRDELDWYRDLWLGDREPGPENSPSLTTDLRGAAPAHVVSAGFDPLLDEAEIYAERLRDAGVPTTLRRHEGLIHGYVEFLGVCAAGRDAVAELGAVAKRMLGEPSR